MPLKDLLLHIDTYPEASLDEAAEQAVAFAAGLGATLSAIAVQIDIRPPDNPLADFLIGLKDLAQREEQISRDAGWRGLEVFSRAASAAGVLGQMILDQADLYLVGERVAARARTHDLCLVPVADRLDGQRSVAEAVIFGSGRPVLLFQSEGVRLPAGKPRRVVLAWDGSRAAARALADALPLLTEAAEVRVLTVVNEKSAARAGIGDAVVRHLGTHGVDATAYDVDVAGRRVGEAMAAYCGEAGADLLVMGAYGHSRVREFILGGATRHLMREAKLPVLLAH